MMEDHMITALAGERAAVHLKYPNLRFPIRRSYLFQRHHGNTQKSGNEMIYRQSGSLIMIFSEVVILLESEYRSLQSIQFFYWLLLHFLPEHTRIHSGTRQVFPF